MRLRPYLFCLGLAMLASFSCSSSTTTATAVVRPQLVAVDPRDFLGGVRCAPPLPTDAGSAGDSSVLDSELELDPNAARTYVATLFDVTPASDGGVPDPGVPLASSLPTTCINPVTFSFVVDHRYYLAEVDAYHERPEELTPLSPGSRLLAKADGTRAVPRWVATCGGYPPTPTVDAGADSAAAAGAGPEDADARPPGVVSYEALTRTPHDCGAGLHPPD